MIEQVIEENVPKDERLVNIFGVVPYHDPFWSGTLEEIDRILSRLGLKVNTFFTKNHGIEEHKEMLRRSTEYHCESMAFQRTCEEVEEKFGVPSIRIPGLFIGATDTTKFVRAVAEALSWIMN